MNRKRGVRSKRGQIWVETVIYTLIAFALIALVLAFIKPRIEEIRDQNLIEQSISVLDEIDSVIKGMGASGNQRVIELRVSKGTLSIDGVNDQLFFEIESVYSYSQPGETINVGDVIVRTEQSGDLYDTTLTRDYSGLYNITFFDREELRELARTSTPYRILMVNKGTDSQGNTIINMEITN
jgi:hypothetical protein